MTSACRRGWRSLRRPFRSSGASVTTASRSTRANETRSHRGRTRRHACLPPLRPRSTGSSGSSSRPTVAVGSAARSTWASRTWRTVCVPAACRASSRPGRASTSWRSFSSRRPGRSESRAPTQTSAARRSPRSVPSFLVTRRGPAHRCQRPAARSLDSAAEAVSRATHVASRQTARSVRGARAWRPLDPVVERVCVAARRRAVSRATTSPAPVNRGSGAVRASVSDRW